MFNQKTLILVAFTCLLFSSALSENVANNNSTQNRSRFPQRQRRCSPTEVCVGLEIDINLNLCATDGTIYILFKNECQRRVRTCKTGIALEECITPKLYKKITLWLISAFVWDYLHCRI